MTRVSIEQAVKHPIDEETRKLLTRLEALRGEARVRLHLAAMDLKDELAKLEPELDKIQDEARHATEASKQAILHGVQRLEKLLDRGRGKSEKKAS
jgi:hypothetical protein